MDSVLSRWGRNLQKHWFFEAAQDFFVLHIESYFYLWCTNLIRFLHVNSEINYALGLAYTI